MFETTCSIFLLSCSTMVNQRSAKSARLRVVSAVPLRLHLVANAASSSSASTHVRPPRFRTISSSLWTPCPVFRPGAGGEVVGQLFLCASSPPLFFLSGPLLIRSRRDPPSSSLWVWPWTWNWILVRFTTADFVVCCWEVKRFWNRSFI